MGGARGGLFFLLSMLGHMFLVQGIEPQTTYRMYCLYTPMFEEMYSSYFLPSIKDNFEIVAISYPQECPSGEFHSAGWEKTMLHKLEMLQQAVEDNWGEVFFYSDVDIIFLRPILEQSLKHLGAKDFVIQQGWPADKLCAGFFVMRGNEKTRKLLNIACRLLRTGKCVDDQDAMRAVVDRYADEFAWQFLPCEQYPNGRRILREKTKLYEAGDAIELDASAIMFHANCCIGLENKLEFLKSVQETFDQIQKRDIE